MKTHTNPAPGKAATGNSQRRRGVALLTVLTIISLSTILILTFFQLAKNEMVASDSYNNGLEAQQIADQAVNLVIRQIRQATSQENVGWASQPGAIRTWNGNGQFHKGYKLYSDDEMVESGSEKNLVTVDYAALADWDQKPSQYVDLNEPVIRGDKVYYPIVDPTAKETPGWPVPIGTNIFDGGSKQKGVEGFDYTLRDIGVGPMREAISEVNAADGIKRVPLPMPVMWLYQLKDGSLGYLNSADSFVPVSGGSSASEKNPIVARFAFWADDETAKLNPNIHAGGLAWDTPKASGLIDRNMGRFQPAQHEWQRYPGHPATTHLAPVLAPGVPDIVYNRDSMELLFGLVPRVVGGGSLSGTAKVDLKDPKERNGLIADKDRLYASLDEFLLEPGYKQHPPSRSGKIREPNFFPDPNDRRGGAIPPEQAQEFLERTKFFLSVVSRAPETTVFNTPRISIWPTHWDEAPNFRKREAGKPASHTAFDELIRFCAQAGGGGSKGDPYIYHFQRYNADSATADYRDITRNKDLYKYLLELMKRPIPGLGNSFADKYSTSERSQIMTLIFDYIRSTNLHDDSIYGDAWEQAFQKDNTINHLTYTNGRKDDPNERGLHKGHGQVTPISISEGGDTRGIGRFYTMYEAAVHVISCAQGGDGMRGGPASVYSPGIGEYPAGRNAQNAESSFGEIYSNFPPLPEGVEGDRSKWPKWLLTMEEEKLPNGEPNPAYAPEFVPMALDSKNWNWQLAWMDPTYVNEMVNGGLKNKYERKYLSTDAFKAGLTRLGNGEALVQAAMVFNMFTPSVGWVPINPDMEMEFRFSSMNFVPIEAKEDPDDGEDGDDDPNDDEDEFDLDLGDPDWRKYAKFGFNARNASKRWATSKNQTSHHDRFYGGIKPFTYFLTAGTNNFEPTENPKATFVTPHRIPNWMAGHGLNGRLTPLDRLYDDSEFGKASRRYDYVTRPFLSSAAKDDVIPSGELAPDDPYKARIPWVSMTNGVLRWRIYAGESTEAEESASQAPRQLIQQGRMRFPSFTLPAPRLAQGRPGYINEFKTLETGKTSPMEYWSLTYDGPNPESAGSGRMARVNGHNGAYITEYDIVQSVGIRHGDARIVSATEKAWSKHFRPNRFYGTQSLAHGLTYSPGIRFAGADMEGEFDAWKLSTEGQLVPSIKYHSARRPVFILADKAKDVQLYGDFDTGMGNSIDGPYINKADEGNTHSLFKRTDPNALNLGAFEMAKDYGDFPYFVRDGIHESGTPSYFSPNRIISSPGQFGSLPSGVSSGKPWQTLLFRPNVTGGIYESHPGAETPHDHYLLDLFWMPVVEPYAISEPLSTGGKVNLNYQILPFRHIHRSSAIRGVFKSEYMLTVPNRWTNDYKVGVGRGTGYHWRDNPYGGKLESKSLRTIILEDETLAQFEEKFNNSASPTIYRSPSEICEVHLVPQEQSVRMKQGGAAASINTYTPSLAQMSDGTYWSEHAAVGDNARERPYSNIFGRVTTKSNTFKVHYRAQVLTKAKGSDPGKWDDRVDQVVAEYRGSSVVERYVDPSDPDLPDYARDIYNNPPTIDKFYRYRVLHPTRFAP